jgi:O-antigen/teichoic acid export membrane protein
MLQDKLKTFASDTLTYGVFQMLGRLFTFLLTPLYSNYLTPNQNGVMAYMFSLLVVVQFIYVFGMEAAYFRFYDKKDETQNKKVFSTAYLTIAGLGFIFTALMLAFSVQLGDAVIGDAVPDATRIFQIVCMIPFFDGLLIIPYGRLRMQHRIKRFAITRFLIILLSVILNAYFVMFAKWGVTGVFLGQLISSLVGVVVFLPDVLQMFNFHFEKKLFTDMLKFGLPTLPSNLSAIALQVADRPIMKLFITNEEIGIYQINAKLAVPMLMLVTVFDYAWKPFFLTHFEDDDAKPLFARVLTYYILIGSLLWLVVSLFIDYIVRIPLWGGRYFIHPSYWDGMGIVTLIMLGYFVNGITTNFAAVFHIEKKTLYLPIAVGISAIASIGLNFCLIPIFGASGAAISLLCSYIIGAIMMKIFQKNVTYKIHYEWRRIAILGISAIAVMLVAKVATSEAPLTVAFLIKFAFVILYIALLRIFGFFTKGEMVQLKKIFSRNS